MIVSSQWRAEIAKQIAPLYMQNEKVAAVMLGGSTARGHADYYSDMEIGVFWHHDPSDEDRQQVIETAQADLNWLYEYDAVESVWSDDFFVGRNAAGQPKTGLYVEIAHYTTAFMEQTLNHVLNEFASDEPSHNLVGGVVDGIPLVGAPLLHDWKKRAATYPHELTLAVVRKYGVIDHFWRWEMYLARSENLMLLYQSYAQVEQRLLHILLGLNRVYYFGFKWLEIVGNRLPLKPDHLLDRLRQVYKVPPEEGAQLLTALVEDTFALVETHLPEVDVKWLRDVFHYRRPLWAQSPFQENEFK